jgi:hypothetical protein
VIVALRSRDHDLSGLKDASDSLMAKVEERELQLQAQGLGHLIPAPMEQDAEDDAEEEEADDGAGKCRGPIRSATRLGH